jgi:LacI family transcriptional regulator
MGQSGDTEGKGRAPRRAHVGTTIADVAQAAGLSPMTVSRVVNGGQGVASDTRARVMTAIDALGYVPNLAARSLAGGRQDRFALLYDNPSAAWLSELLVGCLAQATDLNALLMVERCEAEIAPSDIVRRLTCHRIDGVILPPPLCDDPALLTALNDASMPMVQVATGHPSALASSVAIDDEAAAYQLTGHLIALGHRRIGHVSGNANQTASPLRRVGFERALAEAGIALDPELVVAGDFSWRSGFTAAEALLSRTDAPTAIFAGNDDMAAGVIAAAHRLGRDVPRDLSVSGFDDSAIATSVWPELTTIRQPLGAMARRAIALLSQARTGQADTWKRRHECYAFELVERGSVGPRGNA